MTAYNYSKIFSRSRAQPPDPLPGRAPESIPRIEILAAPLGIKIVLVFHPRFIYKNALKIGYFLKLASGS